MRRTAVALLACLLLLGSSPPRPHNPTQAFLLIHAYYILYTYPVGPHLSARGHLTVPLPVTLELLGGRVTTSPDGSSATARMWDAGPLLRFRHGQATFSLDGKTLPLPEPARRTPERALLVPLIPVLRALRVSYSWDPGSRILRVNDPRILGPANHRLRNTTTIINTVEWDRTLNPRRFQEFVPVQVEVSWGAVPLGRGRAAASQSVYTELRHVRGLNLPRHKRDFRWEAHYSLVLPGEDVWVKWRQPWRSAYWGDFPYLTPLPDGCAPPRGGRYVCVVADADIPIPEGAQAPVMFLLGRFLRRENR